MPGVIADIETCIPALRRYGTALLRDRQEVDELVHYCLVRAVDRLQGRIADAEPRAALFGMLHKACITRVRRRPRGFESAPSPPALAGLDALPDAERHALLLVTVADLSYAETASVLGMAEAAVVPLLSRAREALRQAATAPAAVLRRVK